MEEDHQAVWAVIAEVATALAGRAEELCADVYGVIVREIPPLAGDKPILALLAASVHANVDTCLQVMQHRIELVTVHAPAAAEEYARRLAQRGTSLAALLRAYRVGHARFLDWCLGELGRQVQNADMLSTASISMSNMVAGYIDQTSEGIVRAYEREKENWLRNRNTARAAQLRLLLARDRVDVDAAEATLGYRLRQYHVGVVCWVAGAPGMTDTITRLERAVSQIAGRAACAGEPLFAPRDQSSAWAWLPMGTRDTFGPGADWAEGKDTGICVTAGDPAKGMTGFVTTHEQAVAAQEVVLAADSPAAQLTTFSQVAPVALMLRSGDLMRMWVLATLGPLAAHDEHHARLRETLRVFLQCQGSYKTAAEQLMLHKNTVQYRIRRTEEILGRPVSENRLNLELALQASHLLGL